MLWSASNRADIRALPLADRHYNRQKPGTPQFVPPGRCVVLLAPNYGEALALWVSSWPFAEYVRHRWGGAWVCSCFRNEGAGLSSLLILDALMATRAVWGDPPPLGMVTFVDRKHVRRKRDYGRCYLRAGFERDGETKGGLVVLRIAPDRIPPAEWAHPADAPLVAQLAGKDGAK